MGMRTTAALLTQNANYSAHTYTSSHTLPALAKSSREGLWNSLATPMAGGEIAAAGAPMTNTSIHRLGTYR